MEHIKPDFLKKLVILFSGPNITKEVKSMKKDHFDDYLILKKDIIKNLFMSLDESSVGNLSLENLEFVGFSERKGEFDIEFYRCKMGTSVVYIEFGSYMERALSFGYDSLKRIDTNPDSFIEINNEEEYVKRLSTFGIDVYPVFNKVKSEEIDQLIKNVESIKI